MWDIVFPGIPPPKSPYLDGKMTKDCAQFQEHCRSHGPDILAEVIESSGALTMNLPEGIRAGMLRRAITTGLDTLISNWTPATGGTQDTVLRAPPFGNDRDSNDNSESLVLGTPTHSFSESVTMTNRATSSTSHHPTHQQHGDERYMPLNSTLNSGLETGSFSQVAVISPASLIQHNPSSAHLESDNTFAFQSPTQDKEESFHTEDSQVLGPLDSIEDDGIELGSFDLSELQTLSWDDPWPDWPPHNPG
jgi:hypothetical protein